jgi:hypothetical protein
MNVEEFKALPNWKKVRILSGIIPQTGKPEEDLQVLTHRLAMCCLISRVEEGDADPEFLNSMIDKSFGLNKE